MTHAYCHFCLQHLYRIVVVLMISAKTSACWWDICIKTNSLHFEFEAIGRKSEDIFFIKPPAFAGATLGECGQAFRHNSTWSMCQAWSLSHSGTVTNCQATLSWGHLHTHTPRTPPQAGRVCMHRQWLSSDPHTLGQHWTVTTSILTMGLGGTWTLAP